LVGGFVLGMPSRRTNIFPESGRGLDHVTTTIFGSTVGYPRDSLASCYSSRASEEEYTRNILDCDQFNYSSRIVIPIFLQSSSYNSLTDQITHFRDGHIHCKSSKITCGSLLDFIQPKVDPHDPPTPKTLP